MAEERTGDDARREFGHALMGALPTLRRYALALAGDRTLADDLLQDCLERAWRHRASLRGSGTAVAWLRSILHNVHVDFRRALARRGHAVEIGELADALAAPSDADSRAARLDMMKAMNTLSSDHREVLLLISLEGLSYREAAEELGVPIGTVLSRMARARERLRAALGEPDGYLP